MIKGGIFAQWNHNRREKEQNTNLWYVVDEPQKRYAVTEARCEPRTDADISEMILLPGTTQREADLERQKVDELP